MEIKYQILLGLVAFGLGYMTDFVWCKCMENVAAKNPFAAANWGLMLGILGLIYTVAIVHKIWVVVIMDLAGGYLGTWSAVSKKIKCKK